MRKDEAIAPFLHSQRYPRARRYFGTSLKGVGPGDEETKARLPIGRSHQRQNKLQAHSSICRCAAPAASTPRRAAGASHRQIEDALAVCFAFDVTCRLANSFGFLRARAGRLGVRRGAKYLLARGYR